MNYPHPILAREGWPFIATSLFIALFSSVFFGLGWAIPFWIIFVFIVQFFRDPPRAIPGDSRTVVSPADGRVISVGHAEDPYLKRDSIKISVFMNVFNVHSNRSPVDGVLKETWYSAGKFFNADFDKASSENERNALWIQTAAGTDITCVQVAGLIARRILCYVTAGKQLARGERFGFIRFGSRVDVYLPVNARIKATLGEKVKASSTILAELTE